MMRTQLICCSIAVAAIVGGCKSLDTHKLMPWSESKGKAPDPNAVPVRMAVTWLDAAYTAPGKQATRGFGGRVYFYNRDHKAIPVEGELIVYGYDDSTQDNSSRTPDRKYVFTPEQFAQHVSQSELGPSYSVWIPWDAVGGDQKNLSLLPIFRSTGGQVLTGDQTAAVLPGIKPQPLDATPKRTPPVLSNGNPSTAVRQVSYEQTGTDLTEPRIRTTTIDVPMSTKLRLQTVSPGETQRYSPQPGGQVPLTAEEISKLRQQQMRATPSVTTPTATSGVSDSQASAAWNGMRAATHQTRLSQQSLDRSAHPQFPAPTSPGGMLDPGRAPWQPLPAGPPSARSSSPEFLPPNESAGY